MNVPEVFGYITFALEKAGISYMLSGSFASAYYGAPRSTQDIDLVIEATPQQLRTLVESLSPTQYYADVDAALSAHKTGTMFNVIDRSTGWKIDLIICKTRPFSKEEFRRRERVAFGGLSIFIASAEDIVIAKLEWSKLAASQRQLQDVVAILRARSTTLDQAYVEKWAGELGIVEQWQQARRTAGLDLPES